jgi:hypothetical protein
MPRALKQRHNDNRRNPMHARIASLLLLALPLAAQAQRIVPPDPAAFEPVHVRMTVDSCAFNPDSVRVSYVLEENLIRIEQRLNQCLVAGAPKDVDIRIGALPAGRWQLDTALPASGGIVSSRQFFTIAEGSAASPRPLAGYDGMWFNPQLPGWGLSLHQGAGGRLFGSLLVYGSDAGPRWYTLQSGTWTNSTTWSGTIYRSNATYPGGGRFTLETLAVGIATLEFSAGAGDNPAVGRLTYTLDGSSVTQDIQRMRL